MRISSLSVLLFLMISTLAVKGFGRVHIEHLPEDGYEVTVEGIDFTPVEIDGKTFSKASLKGVSEYKESFRVGETGSASCPVLCRWRRADSGRVRRPRGKGYCEFEHLDPASYSADTQASWREREAGHQRGILFDSRARRAQRLRISEVGTIRGKSRRMVTLFPFRYAPASAKGILTPHFRVTVREETKVPAAPIAWGRLSHRRR